MFAGMKGEKSGGEPSEKRVKDGYKLISSPKGMKGFVEIFEKETANLSFRYGAPVKSIFKNLDGGYTVTSIGAGVEVAERYDAVALCCNAKAAAPILINIAPELSAELMKIRFCPIFMCGLGFDRSKVSHPLDGFGYLVTYSERTLVLGCLFSSSLFTGRAPEGKVMLSVVSAGDGREEYFSKPDDELTSLILQNIRRPLGITGEPETVLSFRTENAIPQYYVGHKSMVDMAEKVMRDHSGIYIGGNTLYGISVADCIKRSRDIAEKLLP
jgi:oxygen-dependent protoporphyrinogen oxidase